MNPRLSRALFGANQRLSGADLFSRIAELEDSERMPRNEIVDMQWNRLLSLCQYAYKNVPYYRKVWDERGISPSALQSFEDFASLPFLTKSDIQQYDDELRSPAMGRTPLHYGQTGGSTGNPMRFVRTQDSKARFWAAQYRGYGWYGIRPGDKQGRFYGMPFAQAKSTREKIKDLVMNRRRMTMFDLSDEQMAAFAGRLNRFQPTYFNGYSTWLGRFADFVGRDGPSKFNWIPLRGAVASSEVLSNYNRNLIESTFACPVIDEYGAAEIGLIAISCPSGGFHTVPENIYLEQIPSDQRLTTEQGSSLLYEVVVTDLHSFAMPLIRYKVGDYLTPLPDKDIHCECGRTSTLIGSIMGRTNTHIITPEGGVKAGMFFEYLTKLSLDSGGGLVSFSAKQTHIDKLIFYVVKDHNFSDETLNFLVDTTKKYVSPKMNIDVEFLQELPRTSAGKLLSFSSDLDIEQELTRIRRDRINA